MAEVMALSARIIAKKIQRLTLVEAIREAAGKCLLIVLLVFLFTQLLYGLVYVRNDRMSPAVESGDLLLYDRHPSSFYVGDLVVYEDSLGDLQVSRIAAMAGDTVEFDSFGSFLVNDEFLTLREERVITDKTGNATYPYTLGEDEVFLLNDTLDREGDSRIYGSFSISELKGKLIQLFRRRNF